MFRKVFVNTGSQIIGKITSAAVTLLVTFFISANLGEQGYGEFTKVFVFVGYFYTLVDFGLNAIYVKTTKTPKEQLSKLQLLLSLRLALATIFVLAAIVISLFLPHDQTQNTGFPPMVKFAILLAAFTIVTQALFTTANAYFQRNLRYDLSSLAIIFGASVILAVTIINSLTQRSLLGYTAAYVFGGLAFNLVAYYFLFKKLGRFILPRFAKVDLVKMLKSSWPIGLALIFNVAYFRIDVLILANTRSAQEVGLYGLAYQFFEASLAIPIFFANALYPLLSNLWLKNHSDFKIQTRSWVKILALISFLQAMALFMISYLIPIIYQGRFAGSIKALQILAIGIPFFYLSALVWHLLIIENKQKFLSLIYGLGLIFNLVLNLIFIPSYGYLAASIITVLSEALILLLLFLAYLPKLAISKSPKYPKIII